VKAFKPGDVLFYGHPVSLVGKYMGGGKMVHAPRLDSRVKITTSGSLGSKPLVGAGRF
jgi:cell wall-associated NlpC family hydrolase